MDNGFILACLGIYEPNDNNVRGYMWGELVGIE